MLCVERVAYSPFFETTVDDNFLPSPRARARPQRAHLPHAFASHLQTASVRDLAMIEAEDGQLDAPYSILVTRQWPVQLAEHTVNEWWPTLAPSLDLLHTPRLAPDHPTSPSYFAARYARQLDALSRDVQLRYLLRLGALLRKHGAVTLVSCERTRARRQQWTQREILRAWFLGEAQPFRSTVAA
jgi:uncharacterized protein YeaO (DUF488 family)